MAVRFSYLALLVLVACTGALGWDSDDDGIPNKYDECKRDPEDKDGYQDNDGCPDPDNDGDGVCDPWVAQQGQSAKYASQCKGSDACVDVPEDKDGHEDADGCPDKDNDRDGIPDDKDRCPDQAEDMDGFDDTDGCPDLDNDKDGIPDETDKCPNTAEDKDGFEDEDGCPEPDNDGDGIKDDVDQCPNEPETMNGVEDTDGCPDKEMPPLKQSQIFPLWKFRTGTNEIMVEALQSLDLFAKQLKEYPDSVVEIRLFMWYKGGDKLAYLALLQSQSQAVVDYLVGKGVNREQLKQLQYTLEAWEAYQDSDRDFNQNRPAEVHLLN